MFNISKFIIAAVAFLFFQISTLGYVQAHERHSEFMMDRNNTKHNYLPMLTLMVTQFPVQDSWEGESTKEYVQLWAVI